jgi:hypothetical protein
MGNSQNRSQPKAEEPPVYEYAARFIVKMNNVEPFTYIKNVNNWTQCIEGAMSFVRHLELGDSYVTHVPIYNLRLSLELRDAYIYRGVVTWSSERYKKESLLPTLKWYIESEIPRVIYTKYGTKIKINLKTFENKGVTRGPLIPVGSEAILKSSRFANT